jgi:YtoQ family protein
MNDVELTVYLAGDIHTEWRDRIYDGVEEHDLPVDLTGPVLDPAAAADCGSTILGHEDNPFWKDHKGAKLNAIRMRTLIGEADLVIVRFGDEPRQIAAAFEAGYAIALGTPLIVLHPRDQGHLLKDIDAAAFAVCETTEQVIAVLRYVTRGELSRPSPNLSLVR